MVGVRVEGRANARSIPIDPSGVRVLLLGTWRLYDGGRSRGMQEEAEAQARALELQREQLVRSMALEVRSAYLARQNAGRRLQTAEKQVALATEAREIAGARYELGTGLSSEIAESQAALAEARFSRLRATVDLLVAVARLRLATGDTPPPASLKPAPAPRTLPGR